MSSLLFKSVICETLHAHSYISDSMFAIIMIMLERFNIWRLGQSMVIVIHLAQSRSWHVSINGGAQRISAYVFGSLINAQSRTFTKVTLGSVIHLAYTLIVVCRQNSHEQWTFEREAHIDQRSLRICFTENELLVTSISQKRKIRSYSCILLRLPHPSFIHTSAQMTCI